MLLIANEVDLLIFYCICFVCSTNMYFSNNNLGQSITLQKRSRSGTQWKSGTSLTNPQSITKRQPKRIEGKISLVFNEKRQF